MSILSQNDSVVLVIVFEVLFAIVGLTESSFLGMMQRVSSTISLVGGSGCGGWGEQLSQTFGAGELIGRIFIHSAAGK